MALYKVLKPIEWDPHGTGGKQSVMYFPSDHWGLDPATRQIAPPPRATIASGCHGGEIPVDATGLIELPDEVAAQLNLGQIAPIGGKPNVSGYKILEEGIQQEQRKRGTEDKVETPEGGEKWVAGAPRTAVPLSNSGTMKVGRSGKG